MQTMLVVSDVTGVANLDAILPDMINYAEGRIYRDLDLIQANVAESAALAGGNRNFFLSSLTQAVEIIDSVNIITPAATQPDAGTRNPCQRTSVEYINSMFAAATPGIPEYFATVDNQTLLFGPTPNGNYQAEVIGQYIPAALSASNTTTIITANLPDIFVTCSMVFGAGYQRDFGSMADDPAMGTNWDKQYQAAMQGQIVQEFRKKAASQGWTSRAPSPLATPRA